MISVHSKNQVIPLPISGDIFLRVINDLVCTNRAHYVQIPRAAYGGGFSPKRLGKLHRQRTHTTTHTMNQNLLPLLNVSFIPKPPQGGDHPLWFGDWSLETYSGRSSE